MPLRWTEKERRVRWLELISFEERNTNIIFSASQYTVQWGLVSHVKSSRRETKTRIISQTTWCIFWNRTKRRMMINWLLRIVLNWYLRSGMGKNSFKAEKLGESLRLPRFECWLFCSGVIFRCTLNSRGAPSSTTSSYTVCKNRHRNSPFSYQ